MYYEIYQKYSSLLKFYKIFNPKKYGESECGKALEFLEFGNKKGKTILIQSGIHAREWITIFVLDKFIKSYFINNNNLNNHYYFILCTNPDGLKIATIGVNYFPLKIKKKLKMINYNSKDFSLWKANANAVDLNVNFDANWGNGLQNSFVPRPANFIGKSANSEMETQSLIDLTLKIKPHLTISLHSKGEEIYFNFNQNKVEYERDFIFANKVSKAIGYPLKIINGSVGGYKDWCIDKLKIPSLTIELGSDNLTHPIELKYVNQIYKKFSNIFKVLEEF